MTVPSMATLTLSSTGTSNMDVTLSGVPDGILEGTETFTYTPAANTLDMLYPGISVPTAAVTVSVADLESELTDTPIV